MRRVTTRLILGRSSINFRSYWSNAVMFLDPHWQSFGAPIISSRSTISGMDLVSPRCPRGAPRFLGDCGLMGVWGGSFEALPFLNLIPRACRSWFVIRFLSSRSRSISCLNCWFSSYNWLIIVRSSRCWIWKRSQRFRSSFVITKGSSIGMDSLSILRGYSFICRSTFKE